MAETNGNGRVGNFIAGATLAFIFLSACAGAVILPIQIRLDGFKEELREFKRLYEKNHDDLDIRLQREMREVNALTEQKVKALDEKLQQEMMLKILEDKTRSYYGTR